MPRHTSLKGKRWPSGRKENPEPHELSKFGCDLSSATQKLCELDCLLIWKMGINSPLSGVVIVTHPDTWPIGKFQTHISCSVISNQFYYYFWILILSLGLSSWGVWSLWARLWIRFTQWRSISEFLSPERTVKLRGMMNNFSFESYLQSTQPPAVCGKLHHLNISLPPTFNLSFQNVLSIRKCLSAK